MHESWTDRVLARCGDRVASKRRKDATLRAAEALQPGATGLPPCFRFSAFQPDDGAESDRPIGVLLGDILDVRQRR